MSKWFAPVCTLCLALAAGGFAAIMFGNADMLLPGVISLVGGSTLFIVYVLARWVYHEGVSSVLIHVRFHLLIGSLTGVVFPTLHGGGRINWLRVLIGVFAGFLIGAFVGYLQRPKRDTSHLSEHDRQIVIDD